MKKLMLFTGTNPIHRRFGEVIEAEPYLLITRVTKSQSLPSKVMSLIRGVLSVPTKHKLIVCESCYQYPAIKRRLFLLNSKIVNLNGGPMLYHVLSKRLSGMEQKILTNLIDDVDAHIVYGAYGKELLARFDVKKPVYIVYPFVRDEFLNSDVKPALASHTITIMATSDPYNKGIDLLYEAMVFVHEEYPDAKLNIITTKIPDEELPDEDFITIHRNVPSVIPILASSSLYIQPSRGDMFPSACLEAMALGIPTIVSTDNGVKEVVEKLDAKMVVRLEAEKLANAIIAYFEKPLAEREALSLRCKEAIRFFNERDMTWLFKVQFGSLEKQLG